MSSIRLVYWGIGLILMSSEVLAGGAIRSAAFSGQPLVYQSDGKINGCGVRVVGVSDFSSPGSEVAVLDSSFVVYGQGMSVVKAGMGTTTGAGVVSRNLDLKPVRPESFWMRKEGGNPTAPVQGKIFPSPDDANFLFYAVPIASYVDLSEVVYGQHELQVGLKPAGAGFEWILAGKLTMSETDIRRYGECMQTLIKNLDAPSQPR